MAGALGRVWNRLGTDNGAEADAPVVEWDGAGRTRSFPPVLAAAALVIVAVGAAMVWPRGVRVYAAGADGLQVTLADDSRVEMRAHAEMAVGRASDGIQIDLNKGDIIVTAARRRTGHLYVRTTDMSIAVVGTIFLVNATNDGSRVAVIEGEVQVREGAVETRVRPGEQVATSPTIARRPIKEDITWSRNANAHLAILAAFEKGMALTAGTLAPVAAQSPATAKLAAGAEFEEASIRECDPDNLPAPPAGARGGGANSLQMTPGRLYALCLTAATLVRTAYGYGPAAVNPGGRGRAMSTNIVYGLGVEDGLRVRGGPDWVRSQRYTIEAVAGGAFDAETLRGPLLRALLERRFGLKAHVETEQIPAVALTIAAGGLKIKPVQDGACEEPPTPAPGQRMVVPPRSAAEVGRGERPNCGASLRRVGPNIVVVAGGATMRDLGVLVATAVGRGGRGPIVDRTGNSQKFNFVLEFAIDENTPGALNIPGNDPGADDVPRAATMSTALEEQLGLRLESAGAQREFIVIDAIERPGAN
jgi:uncharacterized protein (TIGR03435 family)